MAEAGSVSLVVSLQVKEDRVGDFLEAMKVDAEGSRTEPGCLRFDVRPPPPAPHTSGLEDEGVWLTAVCPAGDARP